MPPVIGAGQHAAGRIGQQVLAHRPAGSHRTAAVPRLEVRPVVDVAPTQRAGIQQVLVRAGRACDHRAIQLGVMAHVDVVAAPAREQARLLLDRIEVAAQFVLAGADVRRAAHRAEAEAASRADVALARGIMVTVLLALQRQIAVGVDLDVFTADLRALEQRVPTAGQHHRAARVQRGLGMGQPTSFFAAFARIDAGRYIDAVAPGARADANADIAAVAAACAVDALDVPRRQQFNIAVGRKQHVTAGLDLGAGQHDIAAVGSPARAGGGDRDIPPRIQRAALRAPALAARFGFGRLAAIGNVDADRVGRPLRSILVAGAQACRGVFCIGGLRLQIVPLQRLRGLDAGQRRLGALQRPQPSVALLPGLPGRADRGVERAAHRSRQRDGQAALFRFKGLVAGALVIARVDTHAVASDVQVRPRHQVGAADMHAVFRSDGHVALGTAYGAGAQALDDAVLVRFVARGLVAEGEADAAAVQQSALFLLFQQVVGFGFGGR
ncbi:Uncharacterised protein [Achromobacter xylosoxidans]|nr:Uncharacterised protein [Achromobacter xylosoxidans]